MPPISSQWLGLPDSLPVLVVLILTVVMPASRGASDGGMTTGVHVDGASVAWGLGVRRHGVGTPERFTGRVPAPQRERVQANIGEVQMRGRYTKRR